MYKRQIQKDASRRADQLKWERDHATALKVDEAYRPSGKLLYFNKQELDEWLCRNQVEETEKNLSNMWQEMYLYCSPLIVLAATVLFSKTLRILHICE